jgi:hypothetical protein
MEPLITTVKVVLQVWTEVTRQNSVYVKVTYDSGETIRAWTRETYRVILEDLVEFCGSSNFSPILHKPECCEYQHIWKIKKSLREDFTSYFHENYNRNSLFEFSIK